MSNQADKANDYALANYLNKRVVAIFAMVADYRGDLPDLTELNRSYVLMVTELERLYARNQELSDIKDNICWRTFDTIDALDPYQLYEYSDDYVNHGIQHISQVNKLCERLGKLEPDLKPEIKKIVDDARHNVQSFSNNWLIPKYEFEITDDGSLLVNGLRGLMRVQKVQAGSTTEMILTQAQKRRNVLFMPDLKGHSKKRGFTTSLKEAGFEGTIQQLFMPIMSNQRGVTFRPLVSRSDAEKQGINLDTLDKDLKRLGAPNLMSMYSYPD